MRKYGDAALIDELIKTTNAHGESRRRFNTEVVESLGRIIDLAESYIKNETDRLILVLEKLGGRVPEFKQLGLGDVEERLATIVKEADVVIEKLRAKLDDIREGGAPYLTIDELFDLVKELNELWDITSRFVKFYNQIYSDLAPLFLITS